MKKIPVQKIGDFETSKYICSRKNCPNHYYQKIKRN